MKKGYDFMYENALPKQDYSDIVLNVAPEIQWSITGTYSEKAHNHCATVCLMNIYKILAAQGKLKRKTAKAADSDADLFEKVYAIMGNGPVVAMISKGRRFFNSMGCPAKIQRVKSSRYIEEKIKNNIPVAVLVTGGLFKWHWIICVGVRTYADGSRYLIIVDNWNKRFDRLMPLKKHFSYVRAVEFDI